MKSSLILALAAFVLASCGSTNPPVTTEPTNTAPMVPVEDITSKDLPTFSWNVPNSYKVDQFLDAAERLQALGKDKAVKVLREALTLRPAPDDTVIILCRLLFTARTEGKFRKPSLGAAATLGNSDNYAMEPVEVVEGIPFLIVNNYTGFDVPEPAEMYLNYCLAECEWSTVKLSSKTAAQKTAAFEKFLWKHPISSNEMSFVITQIE